MRFIDRVRQFHASRAHITYTTTRLAIDAISAMALIALAAATSITVSAQNGADNRAISGVAASPQHQAK